MTYRDDQEARLLALESKVEELVRKPPKKMETELVERHYLTFKGKVVVAAFTFLALAITVVSLLFCIDLSCSTSRTIASIMLADLLTCGIFGCIFGVCYREGERCIEAKLVEREVKK